MSERRCPVVSSREFLERLYKQTNKQTNKQTKTNKQTNKNKQTKTTNKNKQTSWKKNPTKNMIVCIVDMQEANSVCVCITTVATAIYGYIQSRHSFNTAGLQIYNCS